MCHGRCSSGRRWGLPSRSIGGCEGRCATGRRICSTRAGSRDDLFNVALVRRRCEEHQAGTRNWQYSLWVVLMAQAWRRQWFMCLRP